MQVLPIRRSCTQLIPLVFSVLYSTARIEIFLWELSLTFPRWFLQRYPELIHNLKEIVPRVS